MERSLNELVRFEFAGIVGEGQDWSCGAVRMAIKLKE